MILDRDSNQAIKLSLSYATVLPSMIRLIPAVFFKQSKFAKVMEMFLRQTGGVLLVTLINLVFDFLSFFIS
jgi:glucose-6-phosphate-specific signal transduction histidine kinase